MEFLQGIDLWIRLLVIGLLAGWLATLILRERRRSILGYLLVGVLGSFVGYYLFVFIIGGQPHDIVAHLIAALAGALVLIGALRLFRRR
jgi:uncharacterized membrane protein YeaQ/YmgE (transglycosylase-associated protein family)